MKVKIFATWWKIRLHKRQTPKLVDFTPFVWTVLSQCCFRQRFVSAKGHFQYYVSLTTTYRLFWFPNIVFGIELFVPFKFCPFSMKSVFTNATFHSCNIGTNFATQHAALGFPKFHGSRMPDLFSFSKRTIYLRFAVHTCRNSFSDFGIARVPYVWLRLWPHFGCE